jgi:hypothetical protein
MTRSQIGNLYDPCELGTLRDRVKELGFKVLGNDNAGWVDKATKRQLYGEIAWILQATKPIFATEPTPEPTTSKRGKKAKAQSPELVAA